MRSCAAFPLLLLAACSGGGGSGGGGSPTPTPSAPNTAPVFTSAATATLVENAALSYQASATDAQSNPITYSIAGGADAARFAITPAGALGFAAAPNFELPADANGDNVYEVQLAASDGSLSSTLNLQVTVTNSREGIAVKRVGTGFSQPIYVAPIPGSADVYVAEKTGGIWRLDPATGAKTRVATVQNLSTDGERGLLSLAVVRSGPTQGSVFVHATGPDGAVEVRRYANIAASTVYETVVSTPHAGANNHNGGWLGFGPDGNLYVTIGDGGGAGDPENDAQNPNSRLGKILRIAPNPDPFAGAAPLYWIPAPNNPFAAGGGDRWVFATGLRNPFRASFGPDGRLYIGDVGQNALEEVDVVRPDQPGLNFGWHFLEGTIPYTGTAPGGLTAPVSQYPRGTGPRQGQSIIGGYVYRGAIASLRGSYVFGDYVSGNIWTVPSASLVQGSLFPAANYERRNLDFTPDAGSVDNLVSFGEDDAGNLYIIDIAGEVFMVTAG